MKFNKKKFVKNYEGGKALELSDTQELVKLCLTSFLEDTFYEKHKDLYKRLDGYIENINKQDKLFILKLAIFGRNYGLKSINHYLVAKWIQLNRGSTCVRKLLLNTLNQMLRRPDEFAEIIGALQNINGKFVLPNILKYTIKDILENGKFDEYQIAKYRNKGDINLYDIVNLTRPKGEIFDKLMTGKLESADTWEKDISEKGNNKESWERLLTQNKLGIKALIMNIRNMLDVNVSNSLIVECLGKANLKGIFPYEFIRTIWFNKNNLPKIILDKLEELALKSFDNLPFEGKTAILVDTSGSMQTHMSSNSQLAMVDLASYYGALCEKKGGIVYAWATYTKRPTIYSGDSIIRIIEAIRGTIVDIGTNLQQAIDYVKNDYDNVIVFSDMQTTGFINNVGNIKKLYLFNLVGYKNSIAVKGNIIEVSGFNDMMFKLGSDIKNLKNLLKSINSIEI